VRDGAERDRTHLRRPGETRLLEADWFALQDTLIEAFLAWPNTAKRE
jgi:hypothetical protein